MVLRRVLLSFVLALTLASGGAAQSRDESTLELGGGVRVHRVPRYCLGGSVATGCFAWEPEGFSFGGLVALSFARTFARVPASGRILASFPPAPSQAGVLTRTGVPASGTDGSVSRSMQTLSVPLPYTTRVLRTDDGGEHWSEVRWRWVESPSVIVFDEGTVDGVAAGDSGYLWSTSDGGLTWDEHGSATGTTWVALAMRNGVVVALDAQGNVYRAQHGNFDRQLLLTDRSAHLSADEDGVVVTTSDATFVVRRTGMRRLRD